MFQEDDNRAIDRPRGDHLTAAGMLALVAGTWLLKGDDPLLLAMWGVALVIIGSAGVVTGLGIALRLWE